MARWACGGCKISNRSPNDLHPNPDVTAPQFEAAAAIAERLERLVATRQGSNRWRFNRVLHLYCKTG